MSDHQCCVCGKPADWTRLFRKGVWLARVKMCSDCVNVWEDETEMDERIETATSCGDCPFASRHHVTDFGERCGMDDSLFIGEPYCDRSPHKDCPLRDGPVTVRLAEKK